MEQMQPKVSLYIPCFNAERFIRFSVEAVLKQTHPIEEIIIVDDGSGDATVEIASKYPIRIIKHGVNKGLAAARNTAMWAARCNFVASIDADCMPAPDWLGRLMGEITSDRVVMTGGRLVETVLDSVADRWRKVHMTQDWGDSRIVNPLFMFGNNSVVRKSVITEVGGYDESLRTNGEDADLSARIRARGHDFVYQPAAVVCHLRRDTPRSIMDTYWRYWRFGSKAYRDGITLPRVFAIFFNAHLGSTLRRELWRDLRHMRFELLGIDLVLPLYMGLRDMELLLQNRATGAGN